MNELANTGVIDILGIEWSFLNQHSSLTDFGKTKLVQSAHDNGLLVHPFAAKDDFLKFSPESSLGEYEFYLSHGVDGIFTEFPKTAQLAYDYFLKVTRNNACTTSSDKIVS